MPAIQEELSARIRSLERELKAALDDKERAFLYRWEHGKATFEEQVLAQQRKFREWLPSYIRHARLLVVLTAPLIYLGLIPFCLLDLFLAFYQGVCFPIYGIPKVRRIDYLVLSRLR